MDRADIWVDTDPTLGRPLSDVDDALALEFLHRQGRLAGISSVFGNSSLEHTDATARSLGERFGVPVATGAAAPDQGDTAAVQALLAHRGTVLGLGPCTNLAAALARGARWERLIVLGGSDRWLPNLRPLHTTELNFALDPTAAARTLPFVTHLVPMEPCRQVWVGEAELARLPDWLAEGCRPWLSTSWLRHGSVLRVGRPAFHPWDVLAAVAAVDGAPFRWERRAVALDARVLRRGHVRYDEGDGPEVMVHVDPQALVARWLL